ncbi:hypothetical protein PO379_17860 [Enterobacter asburiae]|uniref:hypothetical protein n=1 Tax=Enterobacter asburiae TaxID=61645 RepID=UPI002FF85BDA
MFIDWFLSYKPNTFDSIILLIVFISYISIEIILTIKNKAFEMNSAPLTKQYLFKQAIRIPFFLALFFGILTWIGHKPKFDSDGFNNFILISKLPIGILSLAIPFVAVVNNIHRTIQTNTQIEVAQRKNISDSYYSHFKHITDYFNNLPKRTLGISVDYNNDINYEYSITYPVHLYNFLYKDNSPINGVCSSHLGYTRELSETLVNIALECEKITIRSGFNEQNNPPIDKVINQAIALNKIEIYIEKLFKMLCINTPSQAYHFQYRRYDPDIVINTKIGSSLELAEKINILYQFMMNVLEITTYIDFEEVVKGDKGGLHDSIEFLRTNDPLIFKLLKYSLSAQKPYISVGGDKSATEH